MKISHKDWIFIGLVCAVLLLVFLISGRETTRKVPLDENHRTVYRSISSPGGKAEAERKCGDCHNPAKIPFPENHPPGDRCLLCHKLKRTGP